MSVLTWLRTRKTAASATVLALLVATPVTLAVLHQGFPISDVDLNAKDVWVTNPQLNLTGRLNTQIKELNGAASVVGTSFDVMQEGRDVFVYDQNQHSVERVDPAFVSLEQRVDVPVGALITYGGSVITVLQPDNGALWIVPAGGELQFDYQASEPFMLGPNARAVATEDGVVYAVSPDDKSLYRIDTPGAVPVKVASVDLEDYDLTAVGGRAVILDRKANVIVKDDGGTVALPSKGIRLQQRGPERSYVVVATGEGLLRVNFSGGVDQLGADVSNAATGVDGVSAPVVLGSCIHGAWASSARYLGICEGQDATVSDLPGSTTSAQLVFRVNGSVIALNNLTTGDVWLVTDNVEQVDTNWAEVTPPQLNEGEQGDQTASQQTFEETLAQRDENVNQPPVARPDDLGIRPGSTTILAVLDNDTDPDGDVLTISNLSDVSSSAGTVETIDGGRALQFVPAPGASGTISFRYTVTDGRPGGVAEAQVNISIRPVDQNLPPIANRTSVVSLEAGQDVTYNVLADWIDPDGDDLVLISAESTTGDVVRFRPDGLVTFTHVSAELGQKSVTLTVSDGTQTSVGEFIVDVKAGGALNPVGVPDFASAFVGEPFDVSPLANDRSPSGQPLTLVSVEALSDGITPSLDLDHGVVKATTGAVGVYYLKYTLAAGAKTSFGIIRVDVAEDPTDPLPPTAVKDIAYVRPNEPTTLTALANDQSPGGRVIGIQSVDIPDGSSQLSVEILNSSVLRITAPSGLTTSLPFSYTISDGLNSSTAGVTVVPVPELTKHQAPIAADDTIKVRAGDIASVSVLTNDYHPDGARMLLDTDLVETNVGADGLAFVTGDTVRIQAPTEPGQYSATYRIYDAFSESSTARVLFTVLSTDAENNQPPVPTPVTARVFQGGQVTIDLPLDGTDPDGDSVTFVGTSGARFGEITGQSSRAFTYEAYPDSAGTDVFTYQVTDPLGASATGQIRLGVLPRPATVLPPVAVNDAISIRPGRVASVPVLGNDSDPNNYTISIEPDLLEVQDGITATVSDQAVVVEAGDVEGTFILRYKITNGNGGEDDAFVTVSVSADAPPQFPVAFDHVIEVKDVVGAKTVDVDVLSDAQNPGGLVDDLVVSVEGANAASAELLDSGQLRITLGDARQAIAFRLTNEIDDLSAMAFVVVPRYTSDLPPKLKPELESSPPVVAQNQTKEWKISDLVDVPSGRQARITNAESVSAGRSNGDPIYIDDTTIRYTPEKDFRGQIQITFEVTDGSSESDPSGSKAVIQLPVIVGDPNFEDVKPAFSNSTVSIEEGEAPKVIDLRAASSHPNPAIVAQLAYASLEGSTSQIVASIAGSDLTVSAPFGDVEPGDSTILTFNVNYKGFSVPAQIQVNVVASTRPLPQAADDSEPEGRPSSTYTISPLDNDFNPFAAEGETLKITGAAIEGATLGATITNTASTVRVTTGTTKSGTISVIYTVRDATDTLARQVQGRITVVVASAPEPVTSILLSNPGSQTVTVVFQAPASSNGAEIAGYTVQLAGGPATATRTDCAAGSSCTFTGRTNGSSQTVTVAATNRVGTTWSGATSITPYGTPSVPSAPVLNTNSSTATATITPSWSGPADDGGGAITYNWNFTQGISGSGSTGGTSAPGQSVGAGDYTFQVQACNPGGCSAYVSAARTITQPPKSASIAKGGARYNPAYCLSAYCRAIIVSGQNFTPNTAATIFYYVTNCAAYQGAGCDTGAGYPTDPYASQAVTVDGNGNVSRSDRAFGFPGATIIVRIVGTDGEASSNYLTW